MTNQEKFIQIFGIDIWQRMIVFSGVVDQFTEFWTSAYNESNGHKGHWIKGINTYFNVEAYRCSKCNYHTVCKQDICPNCKAEMEGEG